MIDFHSHILPGVDDGSSSTEESIALLKMLKSQGVQTVLATPHFYPERETVKEFLKRRNNAYNELKTFLNEEMPNVLLGAEVKFYDGISHIEDIEELYIQNSNLLLLEMPFSKWSEYTIKELVRFACLGNTRIILAHIERYMSFQKTQVLQNLIENGIVMQANASYFTKFSTRKKAARLLEERFIHIIGSDCHNLTDRAPKIDQALRYIKKYTDDVFTEQMNEFSMSLFRENSYINF